MADCKEIATYYKNVPFNEWRSLKEVFMKLDFEKLEEVISKGQIPVPKYMSLDQFFLYEARTFLRLSIFNLLAYKYLVCGKHLPMGNVSLYYSYFNCINSFLRLSGCAVIHLSKIPEKIFDSNNVKSLTLIVSRKKDGTYLVQRKGRGGEHQLVWNMFSNLYKNLSDSETGKIILNERFRWNYDLLYPSQSTESFVLDTSKVQCENNFLDENFGHTSNPDASEYYSDMMGNYGYEERFAGDLIRECIRYFVDIALHSKYRKDYTNFCEHVIEEIDLLESKQETKDEIKSFLRNAIKEINS